MYVVTINLNLPASIPVVRGGIQNIQEVAELVCSL